MCPANVTISSSLSWPTAEKTIRQAAGGGWGLFMGHTCGHKVGSASAEWPTINAIYNQQDTIICVLIEAAAAATGHLKRTHDQILQ